MNQKDSLITLKNIYELRDKNFFIPAYQRGYRWKKRQVIDLLNDLKVFSENKKNKSDFYCLQPIVVKKCSENLKKNNNLEGNWFEVIDGQQRLTTIYLILHYFNQRIIEEERYILYSIKYETRPKSTDFLKNIKSDYYKDNIDFYNMFNAYENIKEWFSDKKNIINNIQDIILNNTSVIWYQVFKEINSIDIFTRINIGKIPLTNAELIKAMFLGNVNSEEKDEGEVYLKRLQIAKEWDEIEYTLQRDKFWYFIYHGEKDYDTRIEYIFDSMKKKSNDDESYYTFHKFHEDLDRKSLDEIWLNIKKYFQKLQDWFNNRVTYHYIGYLITLGYSIDELINISQGKTKTEFKRSLINKIKNEISFEEDMESLEYGTDNEKIINLLLLFNIQTLLDNDEAESKFPFNLFKTQNWDLEHIHSINEEVPSTNTHKKDWLIDAKEFVDKKLKVKIEKYIQEDSFEDFNQIYETVLDFFNKDNNYFSINDISNLTLLDFKTNRGYGNAVFPVKRKTIINKDKIGIFIPICTKNVFLKYYSEKVSQMSYWNNEDSKYYIQAMKNTLADFLEHDEKGEGNKYE